VKQPGIRAASRDGKHVMITLGARAVGLEHARKQVKVLKRAETSISYERFATGQPILPLHRQLGVSKLVSQSKPQKQAAATSFETNRQDSFTE